MKIPKRVKIGERVYNIKMQRVVSFLKPFVSGQIDYHNGVVKIKKASDKRTVEDTFFHEMAHGLLKEMEFNYPQITKFRNDEQFTQELGLCLRKLFLDLIKDQEITKQEK